jgi:TPR repeat protein
MANREEQVIIRAARAGQAAAQLALGKCYLFGSAGLPKNSAAALYWLDRAAHQNESDAWLLIGTHVSFEAAQQAPRPLTLCVWYERAFDGGVAQAGLVVAKLLLMHSDSAVHDCIRDKAMRALEGAAHAGIADAQWLLAQEFGNAGIGTNQISESECLKWATHAANGGVRPAQHALAAYSWGVSDCAAFLHWSLPLARALVAHQSSSGAATHRLHSEDVLLLSRCAQALFSTADFDANELERFWQLAAQAGDKNAQLSLGLWCAKMDTNGTRIANAPRVINYKKAIHWLKMAGEQGVVEAWYVLSKIFCKLESKKLSVGELQHQ